jgi:Cu2+-exporting ATPase/Cu+-exporting ATPase
MIKTTLSISGMHCASCASIVKKRVEKLPGVDSLSINYASEKAQIAYDPNKTSLDVMNGEIKMLGYSFVNPQTETSTAVDKSSKNNKLEELALLKRNVLISVPMMVISIFVMIWEIFKIPDIIMEFFHHLLPIFATYSLFVIGIPYLNGIVRFVKYRVANMDTLVGIGTATAFIYSFIVSAFEGPLAQYINVKQNYYDVVIVVIGFITLGKYLETRSKLKTGEAIEKLLGLQAKKALLLRDGMEVEVSIDQVMIDDIMMVKPGSNIPLDGIIIEGSSSVDESMITGESIPVDKGPGASVIGATLNKQGSLRIRVTQIGEGTMLSKIIKMVESAQGSKAPIERLADQVSAVFVPIVLVVSLITLIVWLISGSVTTGILSFVGILVIACPCAMGLATPTAIIVGVGKAAQSGILIKNAESLEKCNAINFVVMDKTGTVTKGQPEVTDIISTQQILPFLASLENLSEHPLARAVVEKAKKEKIQLQKVEHFVAIEGKGLKGVIDGTKYYAGNLILAKELDFQVDEKIILSLTSQGKTPIIFMTKKEIIGYIGIADTIKDEAKETIKNLHKLGIKVAMLTGDNTRTAEHIAKQARIDRVIAEVLPADKANEIVKLQKEGYKVAMVGDGINDAPALATAYVGVAMGTGTDVAIEAAGITLLGGKIAKLPQAIRLARSTMSIIKQNLFWAFFYNIVGIPIAAGVLYPAFGILLSPALAGAAMGLSSVSVVLNSLRLKTKRL